LCTNMLHIELARHRSHRPFYLQILEQIRAHILSGLLPPETPLPSSRQLAIELGIARRTVVIAYEELCAQGYCVGRVGQGTIVAPISLITAKPPESPMVGLPEWFAFAPDKVPNCNQSPPLPIRFAPSLAQTDRLPLKAMQQAFNAVMKTAPTSFQEYDRNNGHPALLEAICQTVLPARGIEATPNEVMITNGSLHSSFLLAKLFGSYGGSISYGVPGYLAIPTQFTQQGIVGLPCDIDAEGVCLTGAACSARFHYVMPEHHFPQGITLSPERRAQLLQLADRHDALIFEDDYDSEFYFDRHPLPALKATDRSKRVIYMGTFSKVLFNGLRLGYIVAHPTMIKQLVDHRWPIDGTTSLVLQLWLAELLNTGTVDRHLRRMRVHHHKKRNLIANYLRHQFPDWRWQMPNGGLQFWIELPQGETATRVISQWMEQGVQIFPGLEYCESAAGQNYLILGFGAITEEQIHQAFLQLGKSPVCAHTQTTAAFPQNV
jgi:GntR family transcriptional regulator / MocR family aminotransferase